MSPNSNGETPIQLPAPVEQGSSSGVETAPSAGETAPANQPASHAAAAPPASIPLPASPVVPAAAQPATDPAAQNPAQASDDTDLIEKEWVDKAKQIVERTRNDPYKQTEELTVFKADYMKKRYNRAIKLK